MSGCSSSGSYARLLGWTSPFAQPSGPLFRNWPVASILDDDERRQVESWLAQPPPPESVDPTLVPKEHRMRFIRAIESVIAIDGEVSSLEKDQLLSFAPLLR